MSVEGIAMELTNPRRFDDNNLGDGPKPINQKLKTWPEYFEAVRTEKKTFEVRSIEDRDFMVGDMLDLQEWCPKKKKYTGRSCTVKVSYVLEDLHNNFGIDINVVVLGIKMISRAGVSDAMIRQDNNEMANEGISNTKRTKPGHGGKVSAT